MTGRRYVRLADVRVPRVHLWMLRYVFPPAMAWALRQRKRNEREAARSAEGIARTVGTYMREAAQSARTMRRLTWVIAGMTLVNVVLVVYSVVK
jgi:hypothetical protein